MAGAKDIAGTLDNSERLIVKFLAKNHKKGYSPEEIAKALKLDVDRVRHDCARLSDRGLVSISSKQLKFYSLGEEGKKAVSDGLPEELLVDKLRRSRKKLSVSGLSDFEKRVSLGWAKKNGWVEITPEKTLSLSINSKELGGKLLEVKKFLKTLSKGEKEASSLDREELAEALKARGSFLSVRQSLEQKVSVTGLGKELGRLELELRKEATSLTPELLKGGKWKGVSFRKYNLTAPTERVWPGREHPNRVIMRKIRNIFIEMGFQEMTGPWVETAFWNMDAMFIPQDHPAREVQDTFYLEGK
ncbi:MAG TPA: hypothetical protein VJI67_00240, partial [archaeon]|nr:hypothetical protein [archaeon]